MSTAEGTTTPIGGGGDDESVANNVPATTGASHPYSTATRFFLSPKPVAPENSTLVSCSIARCLSVLPSSRHVLQRARGDIDHTCSCYAGRDRATSLAAVVRSRDFKSGRMGGRAGGREGEPVSRVRERLELRRCSSRRESVRGCNFSGCRRDARKSQVRTNSVG